MTRSMTAYGSAISPEKESLSFLVEIHSINRKVLDINLFLPKEFLHLDIEIRKRLRKELIRGQVSIKIILKRAKEQKSDKPLKTLKAKWEKTAKSLGFSKEVVDFPFLVSQMDSLSWGISQKSLELLLKQTVDEALKNHVQMREKEGKVLLLDIKKQLNILSQNVIQMEKHSDKAPEKYRRKLEARLEEILTEQVEDERLLREVAIFAEKVDITEEIIRLRSHLKQSEQLLKQKKSIGKTLEFLMQEILREINTIASKSSQIDVTKRAIDSKACVEKIREQLQNLE